MRFASARRFCSALSAVAVTAVAVTALVLGAASCSKAPPTAAPLPASPADPSPTAADPVAPPEPPPPLQTAATDDERRCKVNADCTLTTADCCGCNSGGLQVGVRADKLAALGARRAPVCSAVICVERMSDDPSCEARKARCDNGLCVPETDARPPPGLGVETIKETQTP